MTQHYTLYGWHLSYFTGKALCYLRYKEVDFSLKPVNLFTLTRTIKKKTGAAVMPVLKTPQGEWVQDTSVIVDLIESKFPKHPVLPDSPVQKFASLLLEAWGDEWWVPIAMHTRWNYPENYAVFQRDAGEALLPWAPKFLQNKIAERPAKMLRSMLPYVGIVPEQYETMNSWTRNMLDFLDSHFGQHDFLLGARPSLGDFSLVGTMYGHLGRDPWPKRELVDPRKNLRAWLDRMTHPAGFAKEDLLPNDEIPASLNPVFRSIFDEFLPLVADVGEQTTAKAKEIGLNKRLPRRLGEAHTIMGGKPFQRGALPYMVWMVQRALDCFETMSAQDKVQVKAWLRSQKAEHILEMHLPRVERHALSVSVSEFPPLTKAQSTFMSSNK